MSGSARQKVRNHQGVTGEEWRGNRALHPWVGGMMNARGAGKGVEGNKSCCKGCFKANLCFYIVTPLPRAPSPQMQLNLGMQRGLEAGGRLRGVPYSCSPYS